MVESEEVEMLVSLPNLALGSKMQGHVLTFQSIGKEDTADTYVKKTFFQHLVTAGICYKI